MARLFNVSTSFCPGKTPEQVGGQELRMSCEPNMRPAPSESTGILWITAKKI